MELSWDKVNKTKLWWGSGMLKFGVGVYWLIYKLMVLILLGNEGLFKYVKLKIDIDLNIDWFGCLYSGLIWIMFVGN